MIANRVRSLNTQPVGNGPVVYWMMRDQRVHDNWALIHALEIAREREVPLAVFVTLRKDLRQHAGTARMLEFMLTGLAEVETELKRLQIPFFLQLGEPVVEALRFCDQYKVSYVVTDFSPLRPYTQWRKQLAEQLENRVVMVDAHNIVPTWVASPKQEVAAYTFRKKILKQLDTYLDRFPALTEHPFPWSPTIKPVSWSKVRQRIKVDDSVTAIPEVIAGPDAARATLATFLHRSINQYHTDRNDPTKNGQSHLSAYLHFGQLAPQRVALEIYQQKKKSDGVRSFLEECIVRRELADNFCHYQSQYDRVSGFPEWAQQTLAKHERDRREYLYTQSQLERAETHDPLWNACQLEMVKTGKMHGYLRMYWAKKILEWTTCAEEALEIALRMNNRYQLDGRDPNGYVGIGWAIGGVHDRPWFERKVFGTVRYMSYTGMQKKFKVQQYIENVSSM